VVVAAASSAVAVEDCRLSLPGGITAHMYVCMRVCLFMWTGATSCVRSLGYNTVYCNIRHCWNYVSTAADWNQRTWNDCEFYQPVTLCYCPFDFSLSSCYPVGYLDTEGGSPNTTLVVVVVVVVTATFGFRLTDLPV